MSLASAPVAPSMSSWMLTIWFLPLYSP
jgi:hypothetical protein